MEAYRYSMQDPVKGTDQAYFDSEQDIEDAYYKDRSARFKPGQPGFNGWGSKFSQYIRYDVITEEIKKNQVFNGVNPLDKVKVLDVGCGSREYSRMIPKSWEYLGVEKREGFDLLKEDTSKLADIKVDYAVASGSMAFLEVPEVEEFINRMLMTATKGIVFNLLDAKSDYMGDENVVHVQRKRFFSYIYNTYRINGVFSRVIMRTDYFPDEDFTIGIFY